MGFCSEEQYRNFFSDVELFERMLTSAGIIVLKYYLDISKKEQKKRLNDRKHDPLKQWKISPIDSKAQKLWKNYSEARNEMLGKTNFKHAPWFIANAEDKDAVHIALIAHLLRQVDYKNKNKKLVSKNYGLIYPATATNIKSKLYD
jgi:polyphosphate kinase